MLNRIFSEFDALAETHGLEKIKTIGDAYMAVAGLPEYRADHAHATARMAQGMLAAIERVSVEMGEPLAVRIGLHSGPVVAGVIGTRKFFYDVWGDAVNVAARMETTGEAGKIQVSQDTYVRVRDAFVLEDRGEIDVKGKGRMPTWFLLARKPLGAQGADARVMRLTGSGLAVRDVGQQHA